MKTKLSISAIKSLAAGLVLMGIRQAGAETVTPQFSGSDSYVLVGTPDALQIPSGDPFTIEGWVNLTASSSVDMLYSKNNSRGSPYTFMVGIRTSGTILSAYTGAGGSPANTWRDVSLASALETNQWYHLAFSFDGADMVYYLDGESVGTNTFSFGNTLAHTVKIGGYSSASDINGNKSDVRVWDHARSQAQIQDLMERRLLGNEAGLIGYWPMNEGEGTTVYDLTISTNNASLENATWVESELELASLIVGHPVTGSTRFTDTNTVDVLAFPLFDGYNRYQITEGGAAPDPAEWLSTNPPPASYTFSLPATDTNVLLTAWYTNSTPPVAIISNSTDIVYSTAEPDVSVHPALSRYIVEGSFDVVFTFDDIDDGSTTGEYDGDPIPYTYALTSAADTTPAEAFVTFDAAGEYDVVLTITNAAGSVGVATSVVSVLSRGPTIYVWADAPSSALPYGTWESAATNIHDAIAIAGDDDTVWVTNGVYTLSETLVMDQAIELVSVNGRDVTTFQRLGGSAEPWFGLVTMYHPDASVDGFTLSGGYVWLDYSAGILMTNGLVRNCRISGNTTRGSETDQYAYGGGVRMSGGRLENCVINGNYAQGTGSGRGHGAGIYATGGVIDGCSIYDNHALGSGNGHAYGGGLYLNGPVVLKDSSIASNRVQQAGNQLNSFGGGAYLSHAGAVVSNCVFTGNWCGGTLRRGGGVHIAAGLVTHSRLIDNQVNNLNGQGGGAYLNGANAILRNSVVTRNEAITDTATPRGAGVFITVNGGRVENCTVSRNRLGALGEGDGIWMSGGQVDNTIIYYNFDDSAADYADHVNLYQTGGTVNHACLTNVVGLAGSNNLSGDPGFMDRLDDDFRLRPGSPAIDAGADLSAQGVVDDIDGNPRPRNTAYDIGAHEAAPHAEGALRAGFTAEPEELAGAGTVTFTAHAAGSNLNDLVYAWYFEYDPDNPGTPDESGVGLDSVSHAYGDPGYYTVRLTVENAASESDTAVKVAIVRVLADAAYVSLDGAHEFPFGSWASAATNIQAAIDAAPVGRTVWVSNGVYQVGEPIQLAKAVTVAGYDGPRDTVIERDPAVGTTRIAMLTDAGAVLEGVTIRNGYTYGTTINYLREGGGIWMSDGLVSRCIISNNIARGSGNSGGYGGGITMHGGRVVSSLIHANVAYTDGGYDSQYSHRSHGGGIYMIAGIVENCTVVSNRLTHRTSATGGGIELNGAAAAVSNSIVAYNRNTATPVPDDVQIQSGTVSDTHTYPDAAPVGDGNFSEDPLFRDMAKDDFRLTIASPCVDSGSNQAWMDDALDLTGNPRILVGIPFNQPKTVDRGAYEFYQRGSWIMFR